MKISGNTFIVTGGASGLGESTIRKIVGQGANAVVIDLNEEGAKKLSEEFGEDRVLATGSVNVTDEAQVEKALALAVEHFGTIAGAIICHGVAGAVPSIPGFGPNNALTSFQQMKFVSDINYLAVFCVAQKVVEIIMKQEPLNEEGERGIIVMVSSVAGLDGSTSAYGPSKAAVAGLVLPLAREWAPFGIRVAGIAPGYFVTPMTTNLPEEYQSMLIPNVFPKRLGLPAEFANTVSYVLENVMVNGSILRLDAGVRLTY
ncbi:hypothetical protein K450DRAFT_222300 [Umbelopsis ramanniana AG]|uniref:3-hydroxyacyl-CoA dehydrogenase n=1 Tax=Umbelopsis ramanniana AG TaxID=1314678 RepID=A0AAD5EHA3_UMBRA|nr:uncharacterized protein K450DRAFT_222300 [Umbelopsis ramanniana AG]KAI8583688.1 hypothetical protein K450DRAFT_222300 [Umbelopsis ramanniana AG]